MKYKIVTALLSLTLIMSGTTATAFAAGANTPVQSSTEVLADNAEKVDLEQEDGRLNITEAGSYVLTGKLTGCVYVDPGEGDVELILDGVDIDGDDGAGIAVVSGDSLKITLPEGSINRVTDGNGDSADKLHSAFYSKIDTVFEGDGSLYVTGKDKDSILVEGANLTFNNGNYALKAPTDAFNAKKIVINDGHFSVQAENTFAPSAEVVVNGGKIEEVASATKNTSSNKSTDSSSSSSNSSSSSSSSSSASSKSSSGISNIVSKITDLLPSQNTTPEQNSEQNSEQQAPTLSDDTQTTEGQQPPALPDGTQTTEGQQPPALPDGTQPTEGQQPPALPDGTQPTEGQQNTSDQQSTSGQPTMPTGDQMPGQQTTTITSAESASEVVYGTMTNSAADLEADYENATYITVTDDENEVEITSSGTYVVTGTCSDGNITVKKGTTGVILVLDDLDLTSTTGATVSVNKEAEVKIIISGEVVLTDNENPEDEESTDEAVADAFDGAALKTKANSQVYVTGDGTLTINGNAKNGIKAGDESSLIFDGVTVNINAVNDGINSNYDLTLLSGNFTIAAGDDAIHADHILTIGDEDGEGPTIKVTESTEGLEGTVVNILGGDVSIVSSDDAINAANGDGTYEGELDYSFNMLGGKVVINATGDGIDSNGDVNLIDGSAQIKSGSTGGEAGIDYVGQLYVSDDFELNNQSGTAADGAMGGQPMGDMSGQMPDQMGGQPSGETGSETSSETNSQPSGDMGGGQPSGDMGGGQPSGDMGGGQPSGQMGGGQPSGQMPGQQ